MVNHVLSAHTLNQCFFDETGTEIDAIYLLSKTKYKLQHVLSMSNKDFQNNYKWSNQEALQ